MKNSRENLEHYLDYIAHKLLENFSYVEGVIENMEVFNKAHLCYYGFHNNKSNRYYEIELKDTINYDIIDNLLFDNFSFRGDLGDVGVGLELSFKDTFIIEEGLNVLSKKSNINNSLYNIGEQYMEQVYKTLNETYNIVDNEVNTGGEIWMVLYIKDIMSDYNKVENIFKKLNS